MARSSAVGIDAHGETADVREMSGGEASGLATTRPQSPQSLHLIGATRSLWQSKGVAGAYRGQHSGGIVPLGAEPQSDAAWKYHKRKIPTG